MTLVSDIITQARRYVDDNHRSTDGWKTPADWLAFTTPELLTCYRKWLREGLISLETIDLSFTGTKVTFGDTIPLAVVGVVQDMGNGNFRPIKSAMAQFGRDPFWDGTAGSQGISTTWTMNLGFFTDPGDGETSKGVPGAYTLFLHPPMSGNYIVRYIPEPGAGTLAGTVYLPSGLEDYVALRVARKALASEGGSSQAIERLIMTAEADWKMLSLGGIQGDAPKVRIVKPYSRRSYGIHDCWNTNPYYWYYT